MFKTKNSNVMILRWLHWLDPLRQVNQNFEKSIFDKLKFNKIEKDKNRKLIIQDISNGIKDKRELIKKIFYRDSNGVNYAGLNTKLIDNLIETLFNYLNDRKGQDVNKVAIFALGGFGRGELAPKSDIDLLFLVNNNRLNKTDILLSEKLIQDILYFLWDLGFSVGHSTRTIKETFNYAKQDVTFLTSLIDHRFLIGNQELSISFQNSYQTFINNYNTLDFIKNKLIEADKRHIKFGASRFLVEPNVKEGKGGIRDIQTLIWISKFSYNSKNIYDLFKNGLFLEKELYILSNSYKFLLSTRCHLHLLSKRENDNLDIESQIEISNMIGFRHKDFQRPVERFMKRYFIAAKNIGSLTRIFFSVIEDEFKKTIRFNFFFRKKLKLTKPFIFKNKKIAIKTKDAIIQNPELIINIFHISHFKNLEIHPETLRHITDCSKLIRKKEINSKINNKLFLEIMSGEINARSILRLMNDTNVLGNFIPDFKKIIGLIQHDMYHHYTVDEHTFFAIDNAYNLKDGNLNEITELENRVITSIKRLDLLIISLFFHDIAKGIEGDHSINGSKIAKKLCPRLGLNNSDTEIISWLVLNHLLMSETAFRYDLNDQKIIDTCSKKIKTIERLNLLFTLTICDIKAVGPSIWSDWKGSLLTELYNKIKIKINSEGLINTESKELKKSDVLLNELINLKVLNLNEAKNYIFKFPINYWQMYDLKQMLAQAKLFKKMLFSKLKFIFDINNNLNSNVSELIVIAPDNFGLFSKISGILSSSNINIISAKIITRSDGYAIDFFVINNQMELAIEDKNIQQKIFKKLKDGLEGVYNYEGELKKRLNEAPSKIKKISAPVRVYIDNETSDDHTIIEVNCKNTPGILFQITKCISYLNLHIYNASISTYGTRITDIFYVKDFFGQKIVDQHKINNIKNQIYKVLNESS